MEQIKKNDFIELKFTGRVKDREIFDTNIKEDAEKIGLKLEDKPLIICVGHQMLISGFDKALENKEVGKKYKIELSQDEAFGSRKKELVKLVSRNVFAEKNIDVRAGMTLALDNMLVRIANVSGGRVLVDFNNPLAGKDIIYDFTIKRKVEDINEKINAISSFFLKQPLEFEIKDKKIVFKTKNFYKPLIDGLNKTFKDILEMEMELENEKSSEKPKPAEQIKQEK